MTITKMAIISVALLMISIATMLTVRKNRASDVAGYGKCYCCGVPWKYAESHTTWYSEGSGCFPLCEKCWGVLTVEERLPFYRKMVFEEWKLAQDKWPAIRDAVLDGK